MMKKSGWFVTIGILILAFSVTDRVFAQSEADRAEAEIKRLLEEVLVTAQKKEQDLQMVPSSVLAISDEKLDVMTTGGLDIRLLSSRVPSLHIESSYGRTLPRFYIRGLGNTDFDLNASQPVSLVYDEVVLENPILKGFPIFDLDRIEVLRGPQGTLFGRNTPAGIVKFESKKPSHIVDGFGRLSWGSFNTMQFEGALGGPLVEDVLAGRASVLYQGRSDWVDNKYTDESDVLGGYTDIAARFQLLYTPTDEFSALLNGHVRDLDGTARLFRANMVESGTDEIVDGFERDEVNYDGKNEQELEAMGAVARLEYDFGELTLTSITGYETAEIYSRGDVDGGWGDQFGPDMGPGTILFSSETADEIPELIQKTEEVRLASNGWDNFNFQVGAFYFKEELEIETHNFASFDGSDNGHAAQEQTTRAMAGFGAVEYYVTDQFTASGGLRYSDDQRSFWAERDAGPFDGPTLAKTYVYPEDDFLSWDVNGLYEINDDVNVYGRVARGFRAPSVQGRVLFSDIVSVGETEKILSYEGGVKTNLLGNRARANVSVFSYTMDDQQLTAVGGEQNVTRLLNADKTTGMGFEADLEFLPTSELFFTVGTSFNKTEIDDPDLVVTPGGAVGLTLLDPIRYAIDSTTTPGTYDTTGMFRSIDGNSLPNAPEWIFNATARCAVPMGSEGELFLYTDWAYRSEVSFFLYESVEFMEKGLVEGGLRIGYSTYDRDFEIAAFGRNILDDESRTGGIDFSNLTGFVNEPRTFGLEVRRAF